MLTRTWNDYNSHKTAGGTHINCKMVQPLEENNLGVTCKVKHTLNHTT